MIRALLLGMSLLLAVPAMAAPNPVAEALTAEVKRQSSGWAVKPTAAVRRLSTILMQEYHAPAPLETERDPALRGLYASAATALMNGYVIAGGSLVQTARRLPAFRHSRAGPALAAFVDAMLAPTAESDDPLAEYAARAARVAPTVARVPVRYRYAIELQVYGTLYRDPVAVAAGTAALRTLAAPAEIQRQARALIAQVQP